jgi:hypothetical protein
VIGETAKRGASALGVLLAMAAPLIGYTGDGSEMNEATGSCEIIDFKATQARMPVPHVAQAFLPVLFLSR